MKLTCPLQLEKFKKGDFGKCPRVHCEVQALLPIGLSDAPHVSPVKLFCAKCEDVYNPKSSRHAAIDGAYFGTSFANIFLQVYPQCIPAKSSERFEPRVFGFKVHSSAALARWQDRRREDMIERLLQQDVHHGFENEEDAEREDEEDAPDEDENGDDDAVMQQD